MSLFTSTACHVVDVQSSGKTQCLMELKSWAAYKRRFDALADALDGVSHDRHGHIKTPNGKAWHQFVLTRCHV